jgi:phosphohistidine phosphatase
MHQLILMRHAKAENPHADLADHDRALAPEGRDDAAALGARLQALGLAPDVVLVSSARRTRETLQALASWDEQPNIEVLDSLYMATVPQTLAIIRDLRETVRSVLVLGHNPGIHELAVNLAEASRAPGPALMNLRDGFPTASLAEYLVLTPWRDLKPSLTRLQRFIGPRTKS